MPNLVKRTTLSLMLACSSLAFGPTEVLAASKMIYSEFTDAHTDIQNALTTATREHKHVILDFGGNWCGDCQVLDIYFHDEKNLALLESNYVLVHVNIGRMDKNTDIADKYGVPLSKGVPGLAVLNAQGKVLYSQKNGEFESMRRMDESSVTDFLNQWKPATKAGTSMAAAGR